MAIPTTSGGPSGPALATPYATVITSTSGIQSYWKLNEASGAAADSVGAISGTVGGTVTQGSADVPANVGTTTSYAFNNGEVSFGDVYDFTGTVGYTLEAWFKRTGASELGFGRIVAKEDATRANGYALIVDDVAGLNGQRDVGGAQTACSGTAVVTTGTWFHVAYTFDGSTQIVYLNGVAGTTTASNGGSLTNITDVLRVGRQAAAARYVVGNICHVAIYNTALSPATVLAHYNAGK